MSREQRRTGRKSQARAGGKPAPKATSRTTPSRRTPVRVGGGGRFPVMPIAIAGAALAGVLLVVYLVIQGGKTSGQGGPDKAEADSSSSIPGTFVPSQGRAHEPGKYTPDRPPTPFCPGVPHSGSDATPSGSPTPAATATTPPETAAPNGTPTVPTGCYNSNPPSSGSHLGVQNNVDLGNGYILPSIPPLPNVFDPPVIVPRDAIPHIGEHAGVFVGYNCADGDSACEEVVTQLKDLVNARIDNNNDRVVMSQYRDLPEGTIGLSSWTRALTMKYQDFNKSEVQRFISVNSCRYDPENFCR